MKHFPSIAGSVFCVGLGAWATLGGVRLQLFEFGVPASGLFPFLFGSVLTVIGVVSLLFDLTKQKEKRSIEPDVVPEIDPYKGVRKVLMYFVTSIVCVLAIESIGFILPCFTLLLILLRFIERVSWQRSLAVAVGFTLFCDVLFIRMLGVQLHSFNI